MLKIGAVVVVTVL